jgi:hypothetical protein
VDLESTFFVGYLVGTVPFGAILLKGNVKLFWLATLVLSSWVSSGYSLLDQPSLSLRVSAWGSRTHGGHDVSTTPKRWRVLASAFPMSGFSLPPALPSPVRCFLSFCQ